MTRLYIDPFGPPWKLHWLQLLFHWKGSIFQFFWVEWLFATALSAIALLIWYLYLNGTDTDQFGPNLILFFESIGYLVNRFQAAISLMLGFYTTTIYDRWWKVRDIEGVVLGRVNDLAVQVAGLIRDEKIRGGSDTTTRDDIQKKRPSCTNDKEKKIVSSALNASSKGGRADAAEIRTNLVRWLNLSHAIAIGELYEKQPNQFSSLERLVEFGLLTPMELEYMLETPRSRYVAPFNWFLDLLHQLADRGECGVSWGTIVVMSDNITMIRGSLADLYMYRNVPMPLSFRQLVNFTVRSYLVIVAIAGPLAVSLGQGSQIRRVSPGIFWMILPFFFEYFMFVGWCSLADALGNPLRVWADQFEYESYVRGVALSSNVFITESLRSCTSATELDEITPSIKEKQKLTSERWIAYEDHYDDIKLGLREIFTGHSDAGAKKIRHNLTGF